MELKAQGRLDLGYVSRRLLSVYVRLTVYVEQLHACWEALAICIQAEIIGN